jgi:D-amino-acid oxidase
MSGLLHRRGLILGAGAMGLAGCATRPVAAPVRAMPSAVLTPAITTIAPIRADMERISRVTVCLRPFRAAGPRMEVETVGDKRVVHNYGHGGSGWSLSWGSGTIAARNAMATGERDIAVIGAGALGLTTATILQQAGATVTIYAKERMFEARSARATGTWSPDSRVAAEGAAAPGFPALWEEMTRISYRTFQTYLGVPGDPVQWQDRYVLLDKDLGQGAEPVNNDPVKFAYYGDRIADLRHRSTTLAPGSHPFPVETVRRGAAMQFNIAAYARLLTSEFLMAGGRIETREFHTPGELTGLTQKVIVNCTGYGARALWKDESVVPVRGQITWLLPQPEVNYGLFYNDMTVVSRADGLVVQYVGETEMFGYGDENESPDRAETEAAVKTLANLFARFPAPRG